MAKGKYRKKKQRAQSKAYKQENKNYIIVNNYEDKDMKQSRIESLLSRILAFCKLCLCFFILIIFHLKESFKKIIKAINYNYNIIIAIKSNFIKDRFKIKGILLSRDLSFWNLCVCFFLLIIFCLKKIKQTIKKIRNYNSFVDIVDNFFKDRFKIKSRLIAIGIIVIPLIISGGIFVDFMISSIYLSGISKDIINENIKHLIIPNDIFSYAWYYIRTTEDIMSNIIFPKIFHNNSNYYILNSIVLFFSYYICYYLNCIFNGNNFLYLGKKRNKILSFILFSFIYFNIIYILPVAVQFLKLATYIPINDTYITSLFAMHFYFIFLYFLYNVLEKSFKEIIYFILFFTTIYLLGLENIWFNIYSKENIWNIILVLIKVFSMSLFCLLIKKVGREKGYIILFLIQTLFLGIYSPSIYLIVYYSILFLLGIYYCKDTLITSLNNTLLFLKKKNNVDSGYNAFCHKRNIGKIKKTALIILNSIFIFPLIFIMLTTYSGVNKIFNEPLIIFINRSHDIIKIEKCIEIEIPNNKKQD